MSVPELKGLLREKKAKVSGNKSDLIHRLLTALEQPEEVADPKETRVPNAAVWTMDATTKISTSTTVSSSSSTAAADNANNKNDNDNGFHAIQVPRRLVTRLDEMGLTDPTPIQKEAIPHAIQGRDVMGLAQTGTGKTLAFGIPLVAQMLDGMRVSATSKERKPKSVRGLVLAPTRELANQIAVQLASLTKHTPISTFVVVGGQNIQTQINKLKPGTDLLVATPGRLLDLMDRKALKLGDTSFLVLDEADLMLDMGFLRDLKKIAKMLPKQRQTMLFSATMSKNMNEVASDYLNQNAVRVEVARAGKTADKITQELHFIHKLDKANMLLKLLGQHREDRALVFGRTKHGMEKLSKKLISAGIQAGSIHGNKSQPQRDKAIAAFKKGDIKVLVATDVAARGLDIPDVKHVYNYELPNVPEAYIHRIGRTARAGKEGSAIAFCSMEEMEDLIDIQKVMGMKIPVVSGIAWKKHETKAELQNIKDNKLKNQQKLKGERKVPFERQPTKKKKESHNSDKQKEYTGKPINRAGIPRVVRPRRSARDPNETDEGW
jgi:ATP-dependent RNA helicase RhlE